MLPTQLFIRTLHFTEAMLLPGPFFLRDWRERRRRCRQHHVPILRAALPCPACVTGAIGVATAFALPGSVASGNDAMARTIAQKLRPLLGQTAIVDNRARAKRSIASDFLARAAPDGHAPMLGDIATLAMNRHRRHCATTRWPIWSRWAWWGIRPR